MSKKSFEENLRLKTDGFSPIPREGVWENIEANLIPERKKRRAVFYVLSIALFGILFAVAYTSYSPYSINNSEVFNETHSKAKEPIMLGSTEELNAQNRKEVSSENNSELNISSKQVLAHNNLSHTTVSETKNLPLASDSKVRKQRQVEEAVNENALRFIAGGEADQPIEIVSEISKQEEKIKEQNITETSSKQDSMSEPDKVVNKIDSTLSVQQINTAQIPRPRTVFCGILFNSGIISTKVKLDHAYQDIEPYRSQYATRKSEDKGLFSFAFSAFAGLERKKHRFSLGIQYMQIQYKMTVINVNGAILRGAATNFSRLDFNATDSFKLQSTSEGGGYVKNKFNFISIPIQYSLQCFRSKVFSIGINAGISLNCMISHSGLLSQNESGLYVKPVSTYEDHTVKLHSSLNIGPEIGYNLSSKFRMVLRPQYQWAISPIEKSRLSTSYQYWNIGTGLQYFIR